MCDGRRRSSGLAGLLAANTGLSAPERSSAAAGMAALLAGTPVEGPPPRVFAVACDECASGAASALAAAGLDASSLYLSPGGVATAPALGAACAAVERGATLLLVFCHRGCGAADAATAAWVEAGGRRLHPPPPRKHLLRRPSLAARVWAFVIDSPAPPRGGGGASSRGIPRHDADGAPVSLETAVDAFAVGLVEAEWRDVRAAMKRGDGPPAAGAALHDFASPSLSRDARLSAVKAAVAAGGAGDAVAVEGGRLTAEAVLKAVIRRASSPETVAPALVVAAVCVGDAGSRAPPALLRAGWCDACGPRRCYFFENGGEKKRVKAAAVAAAAAKCGP